MVKRVKIIVKIFILLILLCTVNVFADTVSNENVIKLKSISLISDNDTITIGENLTNIFNVELDGNNFVTMYARNVKDDNQLIHITLINGGVMHVRDMLTTVPLTNGVYYISDVFINPGESNYVRYSKDLSIDGALPLNVDLKFNLIGEKPLLELTNLSMASHYDTITKGENERLWLDVEIKGDGDVELVTMVVRNIEDYNMRALLSLQEDTMLNFSDMGTQTELVDGIYYISDLYINPHREDYIHYSRDEDEDARPLEFYVEFKIANNENVTEEDNNDIDENDTENMVNNEVNNEINNKVNNEVNNEVENNIENTVDNVEDNIDVNDVEKNNSTKKVENKDGNKLKENVIAIFVVAFLIIISVLMTIIIMSALKKK